MTDIITVAGRKCFIYSSDTPEYLLIQPTGVHELELLEKEAERIRLLCGVPFAFTAFLVDDWNNELSPWKAPAVFGNEDFGDGAAKTLDHIVRELIPALNGFFGIDSSSPVILGGYSLAGLFSLWAGYTSDRFTAVAGVSPSVWFCDWISFIEERVPATDFVYLSLGRKEEKTRNKAMAAVAENIRRQYDIITNSGRGCVLEWNEGNHFNEPHIRTAKGFVRCISQLKEIRKKQA